MEILLIVLIIYIAFREYLFYRTVLDLTAKIKAQSLEEYVYSQKAMKEKTEVAVSDVPPTDFENSDPEQYLKALKSDVEKEKSEEEIKEE